MTPTQYRECVLAELDSMGSAEKNRILLKLVDQLFPKGDPDHVVNGESLIAEAISLLSAFHPNNLKLPAEKNPTEKEPPETVF